VEGGRAFGGARRVKFFTTPPEPWPYVLLNVNNPRKGMPWTRYADEVWIDSGVNIFKVDLSVKDYPRGWEARLIKVYLKVRARVGRKPVYVTMPDYPDDYHPRSLWLSEEVTNIERTVENAIRLAEKYPWVPWVPVIQGWNRQPESVLRCIRLYRECGFLDEFDYFAVGNLCVENDPAIIYRTAVLVRRELPDKRIHVFGLKLSALRLVHRLIDSFDSLAWSLAVSERLKYPTNERMAKTRRDEVRFFRAWVGRMREIVGDGSTLDAWLPRDGSQPAGSPSR